MVVPQEDLKSYFWQKKKIPLVLAILAKDITNQSLFSEHTLDLCQAWNPLNILSGTIYFNDQNMISLICLLGRQLKSLI